MKDLKKWLKSLSKMQRNAVCLTPFIVFAVLILLYAYTEYTFLLVLSIIFLAVALFILYLNGKIKDEPDENESKIINHATEYIYKHTTETVEYNLLKIYEKNGRFSRQAIARRIYWKDSEFGFPYPIIVSIIKSSEVYDVLANNQKIGELSLDDTNEVDSLYSRILSLKIQVHHDRNDRESPYIPSLTVEFYTQDAMLEHPKYSFKPRGQRISKMHKPVFMNEYIVVDTETTGVNQPVIDIVEVSALHIKDGEIIEKFSELCYSDKVTTESYSINGITPKMLEGARRVGDVLNSLAEFIGALPLLGHNIDYDLNLICAIHPLSNEFEDTMILADEFLMNQKEGTICLPNRKLPTICNAFGIVQDNAHRALSDCMATYLCYEKMKPYIKDLLNNK